MPDKHAIDKYDVIVIGGGPGGYVAAIRCAQLGMKTACIDKWINKQGKPALGGTCLNVGCIPSKALLEDSEQFEHISKHSNEHGISVKDVHMDIAAMIARKDKIVTELTAGIAQLFTANKVTWLQGSGTLLTDKKIRVEALENADSAIPQSDAPQPVIVQADNIIIATGSSPVELASAPLTDERIVDSSGALNWETVPQRLGIIGAGVIGLELGSVWRRLGSEVVILEAMDDFLAAADTQISKHAKREFDKQGLDIRLGSRLTRVKVKDKELLVKYTDHKGEQQVTVDRLIVSVGRRPNTAGIAADDVGLKIDERSRIEVNDDCETNIPGIYAIGDVVRGPMLAHKGSEEGVAVAERIAGQKPHLDFNNCPWVIYTHPEIAWVGKTEQQLKESGSNYRSGVFSFAANGRAKAMNQASGFVKMLADEKTDRILGVHIIGPMASELIGQAVVAMESENTSEDIARAIFAHPSLSESIHEAALSVSARAIHLVNRKH